MSTLHKPDAPEPVISIIVPSRNEGKSLERLLRSLAAQRDPGVSWEAIVADGGSNAGSETLSSTTFMKEYPWLTVIPNPKGIVSTGLNLAVQAARGQVIIRMDVHTEYSHDYVANSYNALLTTRADNIGGPWVAVGSGYLGRAIAAAFQSTFMAGGARSRCLDYEGPVDTVYLGCWRRQIFEECGLFDETLVRNQDDEFNLRLNRAGKVVWQTPRIRSRYHARSHIGHLCSQYFQYGFWKTAVIRKHNTAAAVRHLLPSCFVLCNMILLLGSLAATLLGNREAASLVFKGWVGQALIYAVACLAAGVCVASRTSWFLMPLLPIVFAVFHVAYGSGFLVGAISPPNLEERPDPTSVFNKLSR